MRICVDISIYYTNYRGLSRRYVIFETVSSFKRFNKYTLILKLDNLSMSAPLFRKLDVYSRYSNNKFDLHFEDCNVYYHGDGGGPIAAPMLLYNQLEKLTNDLYNHPTIDPADVSGILLDKIERLGGYYDYGQDINE